jgi:5'-nucleotidase
MGLAQYGRRYEKRQDPGGRDYYWALWSEPDKAPEELTDLTQLRAGNVTLTPLHFNLTRLDLLDKMTEWGIQG